jgi:Tol biopolymer transport system component
MPWRQLGILAIIALVIAVVLVAYVGSQSRRTPAAPFGPAANGAILFARDGDIYTADHATGSTTAIVTGPEFDFDPIYSPDGTHIAFSRSPSPDNLIPRELFVTDDMGGGAIQVTDKSTQMVYGYSFSPDGASIAALARGAQGQEIVVAATDGSGSVRSFQVFATYDDTPPQFRADGTEITFIGQVPGQRRGVYALEPVSGAVRAIVPPLAAPFDMLGASWSPDGTHIAYVAYDTTSDDLTARTHVVAADGTGDTILDTDPRSLGDLGFAWSNDSTRLIVTRFYEDAGKADSVILPIDRSSPGVEIGCPPATQGDDCTADWSWSPDDSMLLGTVRTDSGLTHLLADAATGEIQTAPWTADGPPVWQRLAP